ncbi:MAG: hypothetical protein RLZZ546_1874 [Bacteroidota bacterium]|jgi:hypothetical protein
MAVFSFAQQPYVPLISENKFWIYSDVTDYETSFRASVFFALKFKGDTLINQLKYHKLLSYGLETETITVGTGIPSINLIFPYKRSDIRTLYALMREDTAKKKVYLLPVENKDQLCSENEVLVYDFELKKGERLNQCLESIVGQNGEAVKVDSVFYDYAINLKSGELFVSEKRKQILFTGFISVPGLKFKLPQTLIEGIGSQQYGIIPHTWIGNPLVVFNNYCEDTTSACLLLDTKNEIEKELVNVFPNPVLDKVKIEASIPIEGITIYSSTGQLLSTVKEYDFDEIDLSSLSASVLILKVKLSNGQSVVKRVVKM